MVEKTPQQQAAVARLKRWASTEGHRTIFHFGTEGSFERCEAFYRGKMPGRMIPGFCAEAYHAATGHWPGEKRDKG